MHLRGDKFIALFQRDRQTRLACAMLDPSPSGSASSGMVPPTSETLTWLHHRMRRPPRSRPTPHEQPILESEDVFSPGRRRTVSTPLEASILNNGGAASPLAQAAEEVQRQFPQTVTPRQATGRPDYRRASMAATPSPIRTPLALRRQSVQMGPPSWDGSDVTRNRLDTMHGTYAGQGGQVVQWGASLYDHYGASHQGFACGSSTAWHVVARDDGVTHGSTMHGGPVTSRSLFTKRPCCGPRHSPWSCEDI